MRHFVISGIALALIWCLPASGELLDDPILVPLTHLSTDAVSDMYCDISLGTSAANELLGLDYQCKGAQQIHKYFQLEQIKQGVVLFHYDQFNVDVIAVSGPDLDAVQGGPLKIRYLSNILKGEYKIWDATIEPQGQKWISYTSAADGHRAFNDIFAVKRTVFGQLVGIQEIRATWK